MSGPRGAGSAREGARPWRLLAFLLPLLVIAALIERVPRLAADATGCSRVADSYPSSAGICGPSYNRTCYYCEYSTGGSSGGYEVCAENADGTLRICQTVEQLPGRHPINQNIGTGSVPPSADPQA